MQEEQGRIRDIFEVNIRQNREPETRETTPEHGQGWGQEVSFGDAFSISP